MASTNVLRGLLSDFLNVVPFLAILGIFAAQQSGNGLYVDSCRDIDSECYSVLVLHLTVGHKQCMSDAEETRSYKEGIRNEVDISFDFVL